MALFEKLFPSRKKHQEVAPSSQRAPGLPCEQVRIVLFRECDFRGRKLLFDSDTVKKPSELSTPGQMLGKTSCPLILSCSQSVQNSKLKVDVAQLEEMIFGTVAMSFSGTSYKIHRLEDPARIALTQMFPSPHPSTGRNSAGSRRSEMQSLKDFQSSLEQTIKIDDSGLSIAATDIGRKCGDSCVDFVEPSQNALQSGGDSGFYGDSSRRSSSDESHKEASYYNWPVSVVSKDAKSASLSLESENRENRALNSTSADNCTEKRSRRPSKLGVSVIIKLGDGSSQEANMEKFIFEHSGLLEALLGRVRHGTEIAYVRQGKLTSSMMSLSRETANWLYSLVSGPQIGLNWWQTFEESRTSLLPDKVLDSADRRKTIGSRLFRSGCDQQEHDWTAEVFVNDMCDLLDLYDVKNTNFFISTLVTAVLTHHLGWITTLALAPSDRQNLYHLTKSRDVITTKINELQGCIGCPEKASCTIVTGSSNPELLARILKAMTFFIRSNRLASRSVADFQPEVAPEPAVERLVVAEEDFQPTGKGLVRTKSCLADLQPSQQRFEPTQGSQAERKDVIFVLGECEPLVGLKKPLSELEQGCSQQEKPEERQKTCPKNGCKPKHSGVKFNFLQYPQIAANYMKSKNLEMSSLPFAEKCLDAEAGLAAADFTTTAAKFDFGECECDTYDWEPLQTPSNASELEFTSEIALETTRRQREKAESRLRQTAQHSADKVVMSVIEVEMPKVVPSSLSHPKFFDYTKTLLRGVSEKYVSDLVLQGVTAPLHQFESLLRRDLKLTATNSPHTESVAIVANIDTWEVKLFTSRGSSGIHVGMSRLVGNMLDTLLRLKKLKTSPNYCLSLVESRLHEMFLQSKSVAELLLATDLCTMDFLTSSLMLEVNDIPLLMAIASTHSPQVTRKYGLSFQ